MGKITDMCKRCRTWAVAFSTKVHSSALVLWLRNLGANPYVVVFDVPSTFNHLSIDLAQVSGLLYFQVLVNTAEGLLFTFWRDEAAYLANQATFPTQMGLPPTSEHWKGFHREANGPMPSWRQKYFTPAKIWALIAILFVILNYLKTLEDTFAWMIGENRATITSSIEPINVLVGKPFKADFEVRNIGSLGDCNLTLEMPAFNAFTGSSKKGLELDPLWVSYFSAFKPGAKDSFSVTGQAVVAGEYQISITGHSMSGLFSRQVSLPPVHRHVKVWKSKEIGKRTVAHYDARKCELKVDLFIGHPYPAGLEIEAKLEKAEGVSFFTVRFPQDPKASTSIGGQTPVQEVAVITWRTQSLEAMKLVVFALLLESKTDLTQTDWKSVSQRIKFDFSDPATDHH